MLKITLLAGLLAAAATSATAQEFVSTRPTVIVEAELPPTPPPAPPPAPVQSQVDPATFNWGAARDPNEGGGDYQRPRVFVNEPVLDMTPEPLPAWALEEPVRYIAETCRPGVRPENEEMEACFTRVEHEVNEAIRANPRASEPAPARRPVCRTETTRSQDGSTTSSSYTCTVGDGDPALLNQLLTGN